MIIKAGQLKRTFTTERMPGGSLSGTLSSRLVRAEPEHGTNAPLTIADIESSWQRLIDSAPKTVTWPPDELRLYRLGVLTDEETEKILYGNPSLPEEPVGLLRWHDAKRKR